MTSKRKPVTDGEILDRIDCLSKNMANLRSDIAAIIRDTVLQIMKERKKYVEVGYR